MKFCYPKLNKSGLGNLLLTWARCEAYAQRNGLPVLAPNWIRIFRFGVWIRREKYKRFYGGMFNKNGFVCGFRRMLALMLLPNFSENVDCTTKHNCIVTFTGVGNFFDSFISQQEFIKNRLWVMVSENIKKNIHEDEPFIGCHIRRGDFCNLSIAIDDTYYVTALNYAIKHLARRECKCIRVFSDANLVSLHFLRQFEKQGYRVEFMPKAPAIQDILIMSKADVMVCTPRSTFSMWAVFLGQMPSIWSRKIETPRLYCTDDSRMHKIG